MELHAHRDNHIETVLAKIKAHRHTVSRYRSGELARGDDVTSDEEEGGPNKDGIVHRTHAQRQLETAIDKALTSATKVRSAEDQEQDNLEAKARGGAKIVAAVGDPGTGKTAIAHKCVPK